jgi:hypothetical protein
MLNFLFLFKKTYVQPHLPPRQSARSGKRPPMSVQRSSKSILFQVCNVVCYFRPSCLRGDDAVQASHRRVTLARGSLHTSRWPLSIEVGFVMVGVCRALSNVLMLVYHVHWGAAVLSLALKMNHYFLPFFLDHPPRADRSIAHRGRPMPTRGH